MELIERNQEFIEKTINYINNQLINIENTKNLNGKEHWIKKTGEQSAYLEAKIMLKNYSEVRVLELKRAKFFIINNLILNLQQDIQQKNKTWVLGCQTAINDLEFRFKINETKWENENNE